MLFSRDLIAIDLGQRRLRALWALRDGQKLRIRGTLSDRLPEKLDPNNASDVGKWLGRRLKEAGFPVTQFAARATFAMSRERIGVKRMTLPTVDPVELPEMVRLSMQRDLAIDLDGAVIDFLPLEREAQSTTVLAVALPRTALDFITGVARAAGLKIERISTRSLGVAGLIQSDDRFVGKPVMAIDVSNDPPSGSVEFNVVAGGALRFSRGADLHEQEEEQAVADAVVTETKRTWMSYRILENDDRFEDVVVFAGSDFPAIGGRISEVLEGLMKVPVHTFDSHALVKVPKQRPQASRDVSSPETSRDVSPQYPVMAGLWPLAGLMLRQVRGLPTINFANPRRAPDIAAQRRQRVLAGVGLAAVLLAGASMWGYINLENLRSEVERLAAERRELVIEEVMLTRDNDQVEHLWQWRQVRVDWLKHLRYLADLAPERRQLALNGWTGTLDFRRVVWDRRRNEWSAPSEIRIVMEGESTDRTTADSFRERLVSSDLYTASSTGADGASGRRLPYRFTYQLFTVSPDPLPDDDDDDAAHSPSSSGAES